LNNPVEKVQGGGGEELGKLGSGSELNNLTTNNTSLTEPQPDKIGSIEVENVWEPTEIKTASEELNIDLNNSSQGNPLESERGISKRTGKPKKKVSWAPLQSLESIRTFQTQSHQLDVDFELARQQEHQLERETLSTKKKKDEEEWLHKQDLIQPTINWHAPPAVTLELKRCDTSSTACNNENERERGVLSVFFFLMMRQFQVLLQR